MPAVQPLLAILLSLAAAADPGEPPPAPEPAPAELRDAPNSGVLRWYFFLGAINAHPNLGSESLIEDLFNPAMRLLAPGFSDVATVGDLRDKYFLWQPQVGFGRILGRRWSAAMQAGFVSGKVRTEAHDPSIFLLPLHTDFEIERGALYLGAGVDFWPFGMPELRRYHGWAERFRAAKPYIGTSITGTYATYTAKVKVALEPLPNLGITLKDAWLLPSANLHLGLSLPINERSTVAVNFGDNFFKDHEDDFEGPALSVEWRRFFRWKREK